MNPKAQELDLTVVAKHFSPDGGGHPFACGFGFDFANYSQVIDSIMAGSFPVE
jgi:hypothetical protein